MREISERKRAEEALRTSESFVNSLIEQSPYPTWISDAKGTLIKLNQACRDLLHVSDEEVVGKYNVLKDNIVEAQGLTPLVTRVFESGETVRFTLRYDSSRLAHLNLENTTDLILDVTMFAVRDTNDRITNAIAQHIDITERKHAEEALLREQEFMRALLDNMIDGVVACDAEGKLVLFNRTAQQWHGMNPLRIPQEEWAKHYNLYLTDGVTPLTIDTVPLARSFRGETLSNIGMVIRAKGRPARHILGHSCPVIGPDGRKLGAIAVMHDVTDLLRAQETMKESEARYRMLVTHMPAVTYIAAVDEASTTLYVSPQIEEYLGYTPEEYRSNPDIWQERLHPDDRERVLEEVARCHATGERFCTEYRMVSQNGREVWFRDEASIVPDEQGKPRILQGIMLDITARKRAEEALRMREADLARALAIARLGSWSWDLIGDVIFWSDEVYRIFGVDPKTFSPTEASIRRIIHPDDLPMYAERITQALKGVQAEPFECRLIHPSGEERVVLTSGFDIEVDQAGRPTRIFGTVMDITDRKHAEAERLRLEAELRQALKMEAIGTLATGIAHDFNNLLTAISGYTEMARSALEAGHPARQFLDVVDTAVRDAGGIAKSLLTFSRKTAANKTSVDFRRVVQDSLQLLQRILPASIKVKETLSANGPIYTYADVGQLHQVLMNLITNARDAMPRGGELRVSLTTQDATAAGESDDLGKEIMLVIEDTGKGMTQEVIAKIFDPFFTTKPRGKGTGLGMAIVHGIITEHRGDIRIESEPGKGTRVSIRLPSCEPPPQAANAETSGDASTLGIGRTVLLAEDDEFVRTIMDGTFKASGFTVVSFASGSETMAEFRACPERPSLIVLDVDLPEMSGLQCLEEIRKVRPDVPVLIVTGSPEVTVDEDQDDNLVLLRKPFKMSQLISLAQLLLAKPEE